MALRDLINWNSSSPVPINYLGNRFGNPLVSLRDDMNRLFQDVMGSNNWPALNTISAPAVDVVENDKEFKIKVGLFGLKPDDVEVSIGPGYLTLQGEQKEEEEDKSANYLRREMSYGAFSRSLTLPESVDVEAASASFQNGVLTVSVPKRADAIQKSRKLQINTQKKETDRVKH
jgi:HSP20 family protein